MKAFAGKGILAAAVLLNAIAPAIGLAYSSQDEVDQSKAQLNEIKEEISRIEEALSDAQATVKLGEIHLEAWASGNPNAQLSGAWDELNMEVQLAKQEIPKLEKALAAARAKMVEKKEEVQQKANDLPPVVKLRVPVGETTEIPYDPNKENDLLIRYTKEIYGYLKIIVTTLASVMVVWGGIEWVSSGGEAGAIKRGKTRIIQALAGLALFIIAGLILQTVNPEFFGDPPEKQNPETTNGLLQDATNRVHLPNESPIAST